MSDRRSAQRFTRNVTRKRRASAAVVAGVKWCPRCRRYLAVVHFGRDRSRDDGLSGWCRRCRAATEKERRAATPREQRTAEFRARYAANPAKWHAKVAVARAIARGTLQKPKVCPRCREPRRLEAHHHRGYSKKHWLDVVWRCRQCHALEHRRVAISQETAA